MADFRSFLAAIGYGSARLAVTLDQAEHPRGSVCSGAVSIHGGAVKHVVEALDLTIYRINFPVGGKYGPQRIKRISLRADVMPGQVALFRFEFEVPHCALLGSNLVLTVAARMVRSIGPSASVRLNVLKHRELGAVQAALRQTGFQYVPSQSIEMGAEAPAEAHRYRPPEELSALVEEVQVTIWPDSERTRTELVFLSRGAGLQGWLSGLGVSGRMRYTIDLENRDLVGAGGVVYPLGFVPHLRAIMNELLKEGDLQSRLLRPSSAPEGLLLRPAVLSDTARPEELLRPLQREE